MKQATENNALVVREEVSGELQVSAAEAAVQQEIQAAIIVAQRFPRDEDRAYQLVLRSTARLSFAEKTQYAFPVGGQTIRGPSIHLMREFARAWGNIRHGCYIVHDDVSTRTIRAWAWDLQTNAKVEAEDTFQKQVFRKGSGWRAADERELVMLTNNKAARAKRNCIKELLPYDLVEDACREADATLERGAQEDPDGTRKGILRVFGILNITAEDLRQYLQCEISKASPKQLAELRVIYASIRDGNTSWADYVKAPEKDQTKPPIGKVNLRTPNGPVPSPLPPTPASGNPYAPTPEAAGAGPTESQGQAPEPGAGQDARDDLADHLLERIEHAQTAAELNEIARDISQQERNLADRYQEVLAAWRAALKPKGKR